MVDILTSQGVRWRGVACGGMWRRAVPCVLMVVPCGAMCADGGAVRCHVC